MLSEWRLSWVGDGGTPNGDGLTAGWKDLAEHECVLGLRERQPILVSPDGRVDPRLAECFRRSAFSAKAAGTQVTYAPLYRLFFSFLWQRGRNWDQATPDDVEDWEDWRRRGAENPRRVVGRPGARSWPRSNCSTHRRRSTHRAGQPGNAADSVGREDLGREARRTGRWHARTPAQGPVLRSGQGQQQLARTARRWRAGPLPQAGGGLGACARNATTSAL